MDNSLKEKGMRLVFLLAACASIIAVALICIFIFFVIFRITLCCKRNCFICR